jgi:cell division protein ZapB
MFNELNTLERKIDEVTSLCRDLRTQNNQLRQKLATAKAEQCGLAERMETVRERIEQIVRQLPEADTSA